MDLAVARLPRVHPQPRVPQRPGPARSRPSETPLLIAAVRCTVRYVVLPSVLPLLGVTTGAAFGIVTGAAFGILLILDVIAAISIVAALRRLWRHQHPRRWQYLPVALAFAALIALFLVNDARVLY